MAIVKTGATVTAISGKLGAAVFKQARSAQVVAQLASKPVPVTPSFLKSAQRRASIAAKWRTVTDEEKTFWTQQGLTWTGTNRFGDPRPVSPFNAFFDWMNTQSNYSIRPRRINGTANWTLQTWQLTCDTSLQRIRVEPISPTVNSTQTGTVKFGRSFRTVAPSSWRRLKTYWTEADYAFRNDGSATNFWSPFVDLWGPPLPGEYIALWFQPRPLLVNPGPIYLLEAQAT